MGRVVGLEVEGVRAVQVEDVADVTGRQHLHEPLPRVDRLTHPAPSLTALRRLRAHAAPRAEG